MLASSVGGDGDGRVVVFRECKLCPLRHLDTVWGDTVVGKDTTRIAEALRVVGREMWSPFDVWASVDVVCPFCHRGVAHGAVSSLCFAHRMCALQGV